MPTNNSSSDSKSNVLTSLCGCPTGQHRTDFRQCGYFGCIDLRPWANTRRYRYRFEESFEAENDGHVKGDGRWFVEIICRYGMIYPKGGAELVAYATRGIKRHVAALGIEHHRWDGDNEEFRFPVSRLDEVAAILKPKRRRSLDPDRARLMGKATAYGARGAQGDQETTIEADSRKTLSNPLHCRQAKTSGLGF